MPPIQNFDQLATTTEEELRKLLLHPKTRADLDVAEAGLARLHDLRLQANLAVFNKATATFVEYTSLLQGVIDTIQVESPAAPALRTFNDLLSAGSTLFAAVREPERMASATAPGEVTITLPVRDEAEAPPRAMPRAAPPPAGGVTLPPVNSRDYQDLADEYVAYFQAADVRPETAGDLGFYVTKLKANRPRYEAVGNPLNIPWYFVGCIHALESGFDFRTHLFNGDPLTARTVHVPAGQPEAPPANGNGAAYSWEESATAAMRLKEFDRAQDWSVPRLLYRWERYNGMGYRTVGVPSPYLWSYSTLYKSGRFVADHRFNPDAPSKQAGAATMLKQLANDGTVDLSV
jgi:lysozyme family protein